MATSKAADRGEGKSLSYIVLASLEKGFLIQGPPICLTQTKKDCVNISKVYYSHLKYILELGIGISILLPPSSQAYV